ncbi:hypothetical protein BDR22DRAFT_864021 [Usnea florida]
MQTRVSIVLVSLFVAFSYQACSTTDAHNLPPCPLNAALQAGSTAGLLQTCMYNICCWCNDTSFTSQLNETWKGCAAADRDEAYQFFQNECYAQDSTNTTSAQSPASSNLIISSGVNTKPVSTPSSSSTPTAHVSPSSSPPSSTSTTTTTPTPATGDATGRRMYDIIITIAFVMATVLCFEL